MRKNLYTALATMLVIVGAAAMNHLSAQHKSRHQQSKHQQSKPECPMMSKHEMAGMNERGNQGMGFSQEKTTHHFYLTKTGGIIQVEANDAKDAVSLEQVRQHLKHISTMFAEGNFDIPMFVHDKVPAGVPEMKRLRTTISYMYEETEKGGRVLISSADPQAVAAIRSFLRFQITEHKTGDALEVSRELTSPAHQVVNQ
jgi:hypothetical protein